MRRTAEAELLDLVADVQGLLDIDEFREGLLAALSRMLPSDYVSLNDVGPEPEKVVVLVRPPMTDEQVATFARLAHENPLVQRYLARRDGRAYRFSDVISRERFHRLAIYREFYAHIGVEHQLAFTLPHSADRILGVALSRRRHDYSDHERALVDRARPFLIQAYRNAVTYELARTRDGAGAVLERLEAAGLTPREAEVLRLVALGSSNGDAAGALGIRERTVGKHLERGFRKLEVTSRSAAAARVWELASARLDLG